MEAIENLAQDMTILIIAHRLTTVQRCDFIVKLDAGQAVTMGRYEDLIEVDG